MRNSKYMRHLLAAVLSFAMIISGISFPVFAAGTVDGTLSLGTKKAISFSKDTDKIYKVKIPSKGLYRFDYFNSYSDNYNDDFWVGVYKTQSDATAMQNLVNTNTRLYNSDTPDTDYEVLTLEARTYYIKVQSLTDGRPNFGIRVKKATKADLYEIWSGESSYAGMTNVYIGVGYYDPASGKTYEGTVTAVKSSNKKIVKVIKGSYKDEKGKKHKSFRMDYKKAGTAKITVTYTSAEGKKSTLTKTIAVKKYPKMLKSVKVNGKSVKLSKNKFNYSVGSFKKKAAKIKVTPKSGWKVTAVSVSYFGKKYKNKTLKKSVVLKGSKIKFPKKYDYMIVNIYLENKNGNNVSYQVNFNR